ncbi:S-layer homology domain-containing protein [Paenibacillus hodogayensis]|uniref:S-layer homology domain-containing protein n=1 Tax=Paenibacillus hodogayensis TaxID=279208 RepID=A0ABV5VTY8_9BACL
MSGKRGNTRFPSKRWMSMLLGITLLLSTLIPLAPEAAKAEGLPSGSPETPPVGVIQAGNPIGVYLTRWVLDEAGGYIYAVSSDSNQLLVIRTSDLQVEQTIAIGTRPSDLDIEGGKLYVANLGSKSIQVVDLAQKIVEKTIATRENPSRIAVAGDKAYYTALDGRIDEISVVNGVYSSIPALTNRYSVPLATDKLRGILYVPGSQVLEAYRTDDRTRIDSTDVLKNFMGGNPPLLVQGQELFYAGHRLDGARIGSVTGAYVEPGGATAQLASATSQYVLSDKSVFDRNTFRVVASLPYRSDLLLMDSSNGIYSFNGATKTINRIAIDTTPKPAIVYSKPSANTLVFDKGLTGWTLSPNGNYMYAVSKEANRLLYIRTTDWDVEKDIHVGAQPEDLRVVNDQVYVTLNGSTSIGVLDVQGGATVNESVYSMPVSSFSSRLDGKTGSLFYTSSDGIRVLNAVYGAGKRLDEINGQLAFAYWNNADVVLDKTANILYILVGGRLLKVDTETFQIQKQASVSGFSRLIMDGDFLYVGNERYLASDLSRVNGAYGLSGSNVLAAKGNYVLTEYSLYDRNTFARICDLPEKASAAFMDDYGRVFLYASATGKAIKYDSVQSLIAQSPDNQPPAQAVQNLTFTDTDPVRGSIGGSLSWSSPAIFKYITGYAIYYLDADRRKIGGPLATFSWGSSNYLIPNGTRIPNEAKYLAVFARNGTLESTVFADVEIRDLIGPSLQIMVSNMYTMDSNPLGGQYDLTYNWMPVIVPNNESVWMELYYADANKTIIGGLAKEAAFGSIFESQQVHLGALPSGTRYLKVKYRMESGLYDLQEDLVPIVDNISAEPVSDQGGRPGAPVGYSLTLDFTDEDLTPGRLGGRLSYFSSLRGEDLSSLVLYFLDQEGRRLRPIMEFAVPPSSSFSSYETYIPNGTVIPEGAVKLGFYPKNNAGEGAVGAVRTIWDMPFTEPNHVQFIDGSPYKGIADAKLEWTTNGPETGLLKQYELFYLDKYFMRIGEKPIAILSPGQENYSQPIPDGTIPTEARAVGVFMKDIYGDIPDYRGFFTAPITDNISAESTLNYPFNPLLPPALQGAFIDEDGDAGKLGGMTWWLPEVGSLASGIIGYRIYFVDADLHKLKPIAYVNYGYGYDTSWTAQVPMSTVIPDGANAFGVYPWDGNTEGPGAYYSFTDNVYLTSLSAEQIDIVNHPEGTNDTITVTGLKSGDTIKVYRNATIAYPMIFGKAEGPSLTLQVPQLGKEAGSVYVTMSNSEVGFVESRRVQKTYAAEIVTVPSGPGGGGSCCAGGGGGSPSTPTPASEPGTYAPQAKTETQDGKTFAVAELDATKLTDVFKQAKQQEKSSVIVDLKDSPNAKVQIPAEALLSAASASPGVNIISVKSGNVTYDLPIALFDVQAIAKQLGIASKDVNITVTIEQVGASEAEQIEARTQREGAKLLGVPVEFTITAGTNDKHLTINDFGNTYVTRTIVLPQAVDPSQATGIRVDPVNGELHFVPTEFDTVNGQTEARIKRQGNSVYAVVAVSPPTFADVQSHWAKADIGLLAAKLIVKGIGDNRFAPDQSISRAEFAALLVRSLGIAEEKAGSVVFADVPADAWFAGAVAAASNKGLIEGTNAGRFSPNESITREQMAVMIVRALDMIGARNDGAGNVNALTGFADRTEVSSWAQPAVSRAVQSGLMNGIDETRFSPGGSASRAQVAVILKRMLQQVGFMN